MKVSIPPVLAGIGVLLASPAFADDFAREQDLSAKEGKPAPALVADQWMNTPDGGPIELGSLAGRVVVIDFWGTW